MEVSEIIYNSWKQTEKPLKYATADAKGNRIVKDVNFADPTNHPSYDGEFFGECNLCGKPFKGGIPVKKLLGSSYMDWAVHKNPDGNVP